MARKEAGSSTRRKRFFIVERNEITVRKYLVEATDEKSARSDKDLYEGLLGAIDDDPNPVIVKVTGFATKKEALDSDEAYVVWKV